jgi:hypothetical protein
LLAIHELGYQFRTNFSTISPNQGRSGTEKNEPMKIAAIIARILLGLMFLVFGLNPFLKFLPMPPLEGAWGQ